MKRSAFLLGVVLTFLPLAASPAAAGEGKEPIKVSVIISSSDPNLESLLNSHLERNLSAIPDVQVSKDNPSKILYVLAMNSAHIGRPDEYAYSYLFLSPTSFKPYRNYYIDKFEENAVQDVVNQALFETKRTVFDNGYVGTGSINTLADICQWIVARFDKGPLSDLRKSRRILSNFVNGEISALEKNLAEEQSNTNKKGGE